ncbi:glutamate-1-semialdehyde 2,1-aminomutase [Rhodanobacter denitrificans]|uniref:glutamate-1-semialdehyde 2,1-aminomutase n=1 Tax=Rhodanobacter denitrificans TaxID=666685 RepID=UPI001F00CD67|nr:glutamate-1-semialdehyde 2,1-aminomutase [Rhodanobacter denitrificans]UJJ60231.1 glutamate-1-semialdehyde 2,1-aminomutase [Rhodanobacter denitrificans]
MATLNEELFTRACRSIPGGVNSPVRSFQAVGGAPFFVQRGDGPFLWDAEGNRYIDYVGSWGPAILGHAHPRVVQAVQEAAVRGMSFGAPTQAETLLAEALVERFPSLDQVRLVGSGTEATMSVIRLARGFTGRTKVIKFEGCYHGHADDLLVKAGSGPLTLGQPDSAGVPAASTANTLALPYNDLEAVRQSFAQHGRQIACVIVEPIAGNMNMVRPAPGFLEGLRQQCSAHGSLLIFDEVMTGFRVGPTGVQGLLDIRPDLTTLGKVIGGGMPVAAFGGRRDVMECIAPLGPVYQAGTLSGNPVAVAAGLATLEVIAEPGFHDRLAAQARHLAEGLGACAASVGWPFAADAVGGMVGLYFSPAIPRNYREATSVDLPAFRRFFHACLRRGVYFAPSAFEAGFVSITHDDEIIEHTLAVAESAFRELAGHHSLRAV